MILRQEKNPRELYLVRDSILIRNGFASYKDFLKSDYWASVKEKARSEEYRVRYSNCSICNGNHNIHLHHEDYRWLLTKNELHSIIPLCSYCHKKLHVVAHENEVSFKCAKQILINNCDRNAKVERKERPAKASRKKPVNRFSIILNLNVNPSKIPNLLKKHNTNEAFRLLKNRIIAYKVTRQYKIDPFKLSEKEITQARKYINITKAMPTNVNRRNYTKEGLRQFVGKAIGDPTITAERAVMRVSELYEIQKEGRGNNKIYKVRYIIAKTNEFLKNSEEYIF